MDNPLVSVIVPIYNVEKYLEECFISIIGQTYKNIEIIMVDDGSTDNSGNLSDLLAKRDSRAKTIHQANGGLSDARNTGIRNSKGKYITFVDSDDYINETFIEELFDIANKYDADIAQCDNYRTLNGSRTGRNKNIVLSGNTAFVELMKFKTISPTAWGKLYRSSLFSDNEIEFPVGRIHEDTAVLYKLVFLSNKFVATDSALYYYRLNNDSIMTAKYSKNHYESVVKYHEELDNFIASHDIDINYRTVYKHKALRLLSVLNKLALNKDDKTSIYRKISREYVSLSKDTFSVICIIGILLVKKPILFYKIGSFTPKIRRIMGKA